jgi:hypothetical protein
MKNIRIPKGGEIKVNRIYSFFLDFFSFTNRHIYLIHGKWRQAVSVQKKEEKETRKEVFNLRPNNDVRDKA